MKEFTLWDEWDEHTVVPWWNEGRRKLNHVIRLVNAWQMDHAFAEHEACVILAYCKLGARTWAAQDGGEEWLAVLGEIAQFVKANVVRETP